MSFYGDIRLGNTIDIKFTTRRFTTGVPFTLAGSPVISAYVGNGITEITAGITLTVDFDSRTGLNNVRVVASSGNGFATATNVQLVITTGTVDGVSVVGEVIGSFSIEARSALMPTTAERTLDVSAGGEAGVDWANVGSPTTTVGLSGTTVKTATDVETDTADIQGRLPAALTANGNMKSSLVEILTTALTETSGLIAAAFKQFFNVASPTGTMKQITLVDTVTTTTTATNLTNAPTSGDLTATMKASVNTEVDTALADIHLDHIIASADPGAVVANSSFLAKLVSKSVTPAFSSYDNTTDSLEAQRDNVGTASNLGGGATIAANLSDIEAQTDDIGAAGAGLSAVPWNAAWDAEVQSEVDDALVVHRVDELLNADSDIDGAAPPTVGSVFHELMSKTAGSFTFDQTTDSLEAVRDKETDIEADTQDIQSRLPATLVTGRMDSNMQAAANDVITAAVIADNAIDAGSIASNAITAAKIADGAIDAATFAAGAITATVIATDAIDADALAADAIAELRGAVSTGTADSGTTTTMVDAARTEADTDYWKGCWILFTSGTVSGQVRLITGFTPASDTITFSPATTQAVSTNTYEILPAGAVDMRLWNGSAPSNLISGRVDANTQAMANGVITAAVVATDAIDADALADSAITAATFAAGAIDATAIASNAITSAKIAADAIGASQIADNAIDAGAIASGAITSAKFASGAVDAAALATDAVNEIADGLLDKTAGVETNRTLRQSLRLMLAACVGKLSGAATSTVAIRDTNDLVTRVSASVDTDGNRSSVTLDAS